MPEIENKRGICQYCGHPKKEHGEPVWNWYKNKYMDSCEHDGCECCAYQPSTRKAAQQARALDAATPQSVKIQSDNTPRQ